MLRIYCLQRWYALSDPMAEESLYDSDAMRLFAGLELGDDRIPGETMILNFRHLLERHALTEAIFMEVNAYLAEKGMWLLPGTQVNATIIDQEQGGHNIRMILRHLRAVFRQLIWLITRLSQIIDGAMAPE
jgi:transposase, IS5 family